MRHNSFFAPLPQCFHCFSNNICLIAKGSYDEFLCRDCGRRWEMDELIGQPVYL